MRTDLDIEPDDLSLPMVAARLGKSAAWLKWRLSRDRGEAKPKLQKHHYFGRTPLWTEREYQELRQALMSREPAPGGRKRKPRADGDAPAAESRPLASTANGTLAVESSLTALRDRSGASERVQAFPIRPKTSRPPKGSGDRRRR